MLRRPYSICSAEPEKNRFSLLVKVVGQGTRALAELPMGGQVHCLGPLGTSFDPPSEGTRPVIVAGGVGIAPFLCFCESLARAGVVAKVLLGGRQSQDLYLKDEFAELGMDVGLYHGGRQPRSAWSRHGSPNGSLGRVPTGSALFLWSVRHVKTGCGNRVGAEGASSGLHRAAHGLRHGLLFGLRGFHPPARANGSRGRVPARLHRRPRFRSRPYSMGPRPASSLARDAP